VSKDWNATTPSAEDRHNADMEREHRLSVDQEAAHRQGFQAWIDAHWAVPVYRTPDADDIVDAILLRARLIEAGDTKTARMLVRSAKYIRELENETHSLRSQLKPQTKENASDTE
jgi:hypothetical protein